MTELATGRDRAAAATSRLVFGACPHDCPDTCALVTTVQDGRAVRLAGRRDHPYTRGVLCAKVNRYLERVYHPDRLLYPLRRTGPKGSGRFARISWEEALAEICESFRRLAESDEGSQTILPYSYFGTQGIVQGHSLDRRFFHALGASLLDRTICSEPGIQGSAVTLGTWATADPETLPQSRLILIWGLNAVTTHQHLWRFVLEAQRAGARVIVVDPWHTRTAAHADRHLAIQPGTDAALALGLMHVILADGLVDEEYTERYTVGIEPFRERAAEYPPSRVAEITGIAEADVRWLARVYATTRPAAICWGLGLQRTSGGGAAARALTCLPALTGAWRDLGGGIVRGSTFVPLAWNRLQRPDLVRRGTRTINMVELGKALTDQQLAPPIRALYVYNSNPVAVAPDQKRVIAGLRRDDLFTVVHEQFLTDTADYADVVLPATTQLEHLDLVPSWGHYYLTFNEPAIEPLGQTRSNNWVFRELARRLELAEPCLYDSDEEIVRQALSSGHPWLEGVTFERLREQGYVRVAVPRDGAPFAEGGFPTRSGKCELYSERLAKRGADPLPTFVPPSECASTNPGLAARFPLALLTPKAHHFLNSSYGPLESLVRQEGEPLLFMHSADATARGLSDGQFVEVYNSRGSFSARLRLTSDAQVGVVLSPAVWWSKRSESRTNSNATVSSRLTDLGHGPVFYDNLVEVRAATTRLG